MTYRPIENYGVIGNMRTAALVGLDGSIDWFCFPNFDSPSVFAAMLDDKKGGHFSIHSLNAETRCRQFYWPETNVLMTRFLSPDGVGEIQDFLPAGAAEPWPHQLIRRVRCTRGALKLQGECFPAFDYARLIPRLRGVAKAWSSAAVTSRSSLQRRCRSAARSEG